MKGNEEIKKIMQELGACAKELNKGKDEFYLILRNGIPSALMYPSTFTTVEFSWSLYENSEVSHADTVSKGISEILRLLNDMPPVRSLKREVRIYFLPVNCFDGPMKEIAGLASKMSRKREYFDLGKYIGEIRSRRIVDLAEGQARIEGGDFRDKKAPGSVTGREAGPTFSIKIHYISSLQCEVEIYLDYLKEEFGDVNSYPSLDIDPIFEGRVFSHAYSDQGILREGTKNNKSIYFRSQKKCVREALNDVIDKIKKHYFQHSH